MDRTDTGDMLSDLSYVKEIESLVTPNPFPDEQHRNHTADDRLNSNKN